MRKIDNETHAVVKGAVRNYLPRADREQQIVDRAIELFAQKGFALTTRELAEGLKITQPLLYRYFPSKQLLIERVYEQVFMSRFNPQWEVWLSDRSRPLRERLVIYFEDYTRVILSSEWVRIFLYAGLQDPSFNQRYLDVLDHRVLSIINKEVRFERGQKDHASANQMLLDTEVMWGFHSSFFYIGVRKWVYQLPVPDDIGTLIRGRVDAFLDGVLQQAVTLPLTGAVLSRSSVRPSGRSQIRSGNSL